jgi:Tfp pilus assembly protein PilV
MIFVHISVASYLDTQDSAEQTVFSFAANMMTTMYMRLINQRNRTQEKQSFYHMNIGYQRTLSYMKKDGSFSLFRSDWYGALSYVFSLGYLHITPCPNWWLCA